MMAPIVELEDVAGAVVADVRWYLDGRSGEEAFLAGHLPGAVFIDLEKGLAGAPGPGRGRHPLPAPEVFAEAMMRAGIADSSRVVAYDDAGGTVAARLVWMLRVTGHPAALLNGGIQSYTGALESGPTRPERAVFTPSEWPQDRLATIDDTTSGRFDVIDARAPERYRGDVEPVDPRAGHIPGARNVPCRDHLDPAGRFLPAGDVRARFGELKVGEVVSYCGSGVTACHNLLAMEYAGLPPGRLYPGSWSAYSSDPQRPIETG